MASKGLDHWLDILVVVIYFALVLAIGLWAACKQKRGSVDSYFLAGRNMIWFAIGASLFSSNIGSEHFIGLAGAGAASGIAVISYEWMGMPLLIILAWLFVPVYVSAGVYTLPEYMEKRFGGKRIRIYLSVLALVLYIVTKLAVTIFSGALFIQLAIGWNMYLSIVILLAITGLYTIFGGLAAVMYTDTFQTVVMTVGAFSLMGIGFNKIGGYDDLIQLYMNATPSHRNVNSSCGSPREDAFHIFRDPVMSDNPWPGLLLQTSIGCLWYFCCDQVIVQRSLAAKNLSHAKAGSVLAGYLKLIPLFIMVLPGMMSRALFPDEVACVDPEECKKYCDNPVGCSNIAYPKLVMELLPNGVRGLLMAVMLSAIMSSLTSIFNSASTLFTMDLWRRLRPLATERELLIVGRIFIVILCGMSILWIPLVRSSQGGQLFVYIQAVQGYLGTPIGALFLLAILWKRMTEHGAFWGILIGHTCGVIRMVIDFSFSSPECDQPDTRPRILSYVHYTYFGPLLLVITTMCIIVISFMTEPLNEDQIRGITLWTIEKYGSNKNNVEETSSDDDEKQDLNNEDNGFTFDKAVEESTSEEITPARKWKGFYNMLCGISTEHSEEWKRRQRIQQSRHFVKENPRWKQILNYTAIIGVIVTAFLYGYYH